MPQTFYTEAEHNAERAKWIAELDKAARLVALHAPWEAGTQMEEHKGCGINHGGYCHGCPAVEFCPEEFKNFPK